MKKKKYISIFRQLIYNIIIPVVIAMLVLGYLNFRHTKDILMAAHDEKNEIIADEIRYILELQDAALEILDEQLNVKMESYSSHIILDYFANTRSIDNVDLAKVRLAVGMDTAQNDIYIIDTNGVIINTTFNRDLGLCLFSFGEEHRKHLESVLHGGKFVSERFAIESHTKRLKKFTYQPTPDGKYIVEIGIYSKKADEIIDLIRSRIDDLSLKQTSIVSVNLFIGSDNPFSLNGNASIDAEHKDKVMDLFKTKKKYSVIQDVGDREMVYDYVYMDRKNTDLYKGSVIRIISDRSGEKKILYQELMKFLIIFGVTLFLVIILIYRQTKVIIEPIRKLMEKVVRITEGNFHERAEEIGNNEITTLSKRFNMMIEQLEEYYNDLEQKVRERTSEIIQQKEEIEAQRDALELQRNQLYSTNVKLDKAFHEIEQQKKHITDSIHYASRIQHAIMPPSEFVKQVLPQSFILYNPKDIVSGDFYWVMQADGKAYFAAVDCTGHGVPGAFMSIVGHDQLNYALNVKGARQPDQILNELNKGVSGTLRQKPGLAAVRDGMDIALCCIDYNKKTIQYAGAYNPLIIVRNGEMQIVKGDRFPIGAFVGETLQLFKNNEIQLQTGDMLYVFSDGYADQFGGTNEKKEKLLGKRFREFLLGIHARNMDEQLEALLQHYIEWKGSEEQVDDILVIGVRI